MEKDAELSRISLSYSRRRELPPDRYSFFNPSQLLLMQQRERMMFRLLRDNGWTPSHLEAAKILEVGSGTGGVLRRFSLYGALPENLHGVDVLTDRIEEARRRSPQIQFLVGDGRHLPFDSESFDLVLQFTMFSSILDDKICEQVASEMLRVLRPGGSVLWYDLIHNNPMNKDVRGISLRTVKRLFPSCTITWRRTVLVPPLSRFITSFSWTLAEILHMFPFLRSHAIALIQKPAVVGGGAVHR